MIRIVQAIGFLLAVVLSAGTVWADDHSPLEHKFLLKEHDGFIEFGEPEKGTANARILQDKGVIIMEVFTPAYNIHGVEAAPSARTDEEKQAVEKAKERFFAAPQRYFSFVPFKACALNTIVYRLEQTPTAKDQANLSVTRWRHFDIRSEMVFGCKNASPEKMVVELFAAFPRVKVINAQLISNGGDLRRIKLTPETPVVQFTRSSTAKMKN